MIGDTVNVASRIESLTKQYGKSILASEATRVAAGELASWSVIGDVQVQGKSEPVAVLCPQAL